MYTHIHTYIHIYMYIFNSTLLAPKKQCFWQKVWFLGKVSVGHILDVHIKW